jgi:hypothetical protein
MITATHIHCLVSNEPFSENETLFDCVDIELLKKNLDVKYIDIYCREDFQGYPQWIIDFRNNEGVALCVKYPASISDKEIIRFTSPVVKHFQELRNSKLN